MNPSKAVLLMHGSVAIASLTAVPKLPAENTTYEASKLEEFSADKHRFYSKIAERKICSLFQRTPES